MKVCIVTFNYLIHYKNQN